MNHRFMDEPRFVRGRPGLSWAARAPRVRAWPCYKTIRTWLCLFYYVMGERIGGGKARYWMVTIREEDWNPTLPEGVEYIRGQLEVGEGGFRHWQVVMYFRKQVRLGAAKHSLGVPSAHLEPTRSRAAKDYVWKEETRVDGTKFELGSESVSRAEPTDWERIWEFAKNGELTNIPADIRVRCYSSLRRIHADFAEPVGVVRSCVVFWGDTGTGKSRRAWEEAGMDAYPKDPRSKFWCGYRGQKNIVFDEFRGGIDIGHLLRWLDRYPVNVEIKGGSVPFAGEKVWITSNLDPRFWYPELDSATLEALMRRLTVTHFNKSLM